MASLDVIFPGCNLRGQRTRAHAERIRGDRRNLMRVGRANGRPLGSRARRVRLPARGPQRPRSRKPRADEGRNPMRKTGTGPTSRTCASNFFDPPQKAGPLSEAPAPTLRAPPCRALVSKTGGNGCLGQSRQTKLKKASREPPGKPFSKLSCSEEGCFLLSRSRAKTRKLLLFYNFMHNFNML